MFALKGFRVITCPHNRPEVTAAQLEMMQAFRSGSNHKLRDRFYGFMQTVWSPSGRFLNLYYGNQEHAEGTGPAESFREMIRYYGRGK